MSQRDDDLKMLQKLLDGHLDELTDREAEAFADMRLTLTAYTGVSGFEQLTDKQRAWVTSVHERIVPQYANLVSRGLVPRGREVPSMVGPLPKKPPPLPKEPDRPAVAREHHPFRMTGLDDRDDD
jgi:hypothetical protein